MIKVICLKKVPIEQRRPFSKAVGNENRLTRILTALHTRIKLVDP
jgi:hypothetical protein